MAHLTNFSFEYINFMQFSHKGPLYYFMVQKSREWPKTPIKEVLSSIDLGSWPCACYTLELISRPSGSDHRRAPFQEEFDPGIDFDLIFDFYWACRKAGALYKRERERERERERKRERERERESDLQLCYGRTVLLSCLKKVNIGGVRC